MICDNAIFHEHVFLFVSLLSKYLEQTFLSDSDSPSSLIFTFRLQYKYVQK